jgi:hypothetical protein
MKRDAKELCLIALVGWIVASGIWSCGSQIGSAATLVYKHVSFK